MKILLNPVNILYFYLLTSQNPFKIGKIKKKQKMLNIEQKNDFENLALNENNMNIDNEKAISKTIYQENEIFDFIPCPLWEKIFEILVLQGNIRQNLKNLRCACKSFRNIISKFWEQLLPLHQLPMYFQTCERIQFFPQSIYVLAPKESELSVLTKNLQWIPSNVKRIKIDPFIKIVNEDLKYLHSRVESLDLEYCSNIDNEGLKYLPPTLKSLNIKYCFKINVEGLQILPLDIQLYFSFITESTLLIEAVATNNLELVKSLLKKGANIHQSTHLNCSPLYIACQLNYLDIAKELIRNGANVNQATLSGCTPLYMASERGYLAIVRELIRNGANLNQGTHANQCTPLFMASQEGRFEIVKELIQNGANVNSTTINNGCSSLYFASQEGYLEIVQILLQNGANTNAICEEENDYLSQSPKDSIDLTAKYFFTPLYIAWWKDKEGSINLLKSFSDIELNIHLAKKNHHPNALHFFQTLSM